MELNVTRRFHRAPFMRKRYDISDPTLNRYIRSGKIPQPSFINKQRVWTDEQVLEADESLISAEPCPAPPLPVSRRERGV